MQIEAEGGHYRQSRVCERSGKRSGATQKSGGAERSAERKVAERERIGERRLQD